MVNLVKDIFMFFARFPQKEGVLQLFTNGRSDMPEYNDWMQEVHQLPDQSLFPEIKMCIRDSIYTYRCRRLYNACSECR